MDSHGMRPCQRNRRSGQGMRLRTNGSGSVRDDLEGPREGLLRRRQPRQPGGDPRSSGVVYGIADRRLYIAVAADGWKARQIATGQAVAVTVPVRRGGILSLLLPIPPATITFRRHGDGPPGRLARCRLGVEGARELVPDGGKAPSPVIELVPEGRFLTYGIGVSLMDMRVPSLARASVPVT